MTLWTPMLRFHGWWQAWWFERWSGTKTERTDLYLYISRTHPSTEAHVSVLTEYGRLFNCYAGGGLLSVSRLEQSQFYYGPLTCSIRSLRHKSKIAMTRLLSRLYLYCPNSRIVLKCKQTIWNITSTLSENDFIRLKYRIKSSLAIGGSTQNDNMARNIRHSL